MPRKCTSYKFALSETCGGFGGEDKLGRYPDAPLAKESRVPICASLFKPSAIASPSPTYRTCNNAMVLLLVKESHHAELVCCCCDVCVKAVQACLPVNVCALNRSGRTGRRKKRRRRRACLRARGVRDWMGWGRVRNGGGEGSGWGFQRQRKRRTL